MQVKRIIIMGLIINKLYLVCHVIINSCLLWMNTLSTKERLLYVNVFLLPYVLLCYLETGTIWLWWYYALIIILCTDQLKYYVLYIKLLLMT